MPSSRIRISRVSDAGLEVHHFVSPRRAESSSRGLLPRTGSSEVPPLNAPPATTPAGGVPLLERIRRATLGRFDVMTALGEGGMATVFLARDLALDRQVAIKVMNPAHMSSPAALGRFRREARIAAALDHPHIISIFAVGEDAELAYYVMRYVEGRSLHELIRQEGAQTFRRTEAIVSDVGQALHYAHRRGVIHRDVKPANIMLDQDDWLFVTDFGIAKLDEVDRLTISGHVFGTPHYMSPEYFNGGLIGSGSDQYALGVVAYELLTGATPFPGDTIGEVMRGHLFDPIPPLRTIRPDLPEAVEQVVHRMLQKDAALRFPTVADAVSAFKAAGRSGESGAITEIIDTPARPVVVNRPRATPSGGLRVPLSWPMRAVLGIGAVAAFGTALLLVNGIIDANQVPASDTTTSSTPPVVDRAPPAPQPSAPTASETRSGSTDSKAASAETKPVSVETKATAAPPPAPAPTGPPGTVRIGSRMPLAVLYVNGGSAQVIGEKGLQRVSVGPGSVRLSIRSERCVSWDTTVTVRSNQETTVGWRNPRCP